MFDSIQTTCVGAAAVLDTVLLLALVERRNWRRVILPAVVLAGAVWSWHASVFAYVLLAETTGRWAQEVRSAVVSAMTAGVLLIPSAIVHGVFRLREAGRPPSAASRVLRVAAYAPAAAFAFAPAHSPADPGRSFVPLQGPWLTAYVVWLCAAALWCCGALVELRARTADARAGSFAAWMAAALLFATASIALLHFYAFDAWPACSAGLRLFALLLPVLPGALFALHVIRFNVLEIVMERTLVYGAMVASVILFHHFALADLTAALGDRFRVDFAIVEWVAVLALILAYQPLRRRAGEALRYLLGVRISEERDRFREASVRMPATVGQAPGEALRWFLEQVAPALGADGSAAWLFGPAGEVVTRTGDADRFGDDAAREVFGGLGVGRVRTRFESPRLPAVAALRKAGASLGVKLEDGDVAGLLLFGRRSGNREYSHEEINSIVLLAAELSGALRQSRLQAERLLAERRALQSEKLSALGLLASSIAHEVKNPLSSMKTIATVLAEDLGSKSEHGRDVQLLLEEIDRLATRTSALLEFARPPREKGGPSDVPAVLEKTLGIMRHLAKQRNVSIGMHVEGEPQRVAADEASLREVIFNLLTNSIDAAAGRDAGGARVDVSCRCEDGHVLLEVRDNGPGLPDMVRERLFEPFVTTKESGTGLGLYAVCRRVREQGGEVSCRSSPGQGTTFIVKLPRGAA